MASVMPTKMGMAKTVKNNAHDSRIRAIANHTTPPMLNAANMPSQIHIAMLMLTLLPPIYARYA